MVADFGGKSSRSTPLTAPFPHSRWCAIIWTQISHFWCFCYLHFRLTFCFESLPCTLCFILSYQTWKGGSENLNNTQASWVFNAAVILEQSLGTLPLMWTFLSLFRIKISAVPGRRQHDKAARGLWLSFLLTIRLWQLSMEGAGRGRILGQEMSLSRWEDKF